MIKTRTAHNSEQTEINVSPLIDMVFILLIFFIVATSFVDEIGISSDYKDSNSVLKNDKSPVFFTLPCQVKLLLRYFSGSGWRRTEIRNHFHSEPPSIIIQVKQGSKAGLATQVMDHTNVQKQLKSPPLNNERKCIIKLDSRY